MTCLAEKFQMFLFVVFFLINASQLINISSILQRLLFLHLNFGLLYQVLFSYVQCVAHVLCFCFSFHSRYPSFIAFVSNKSHPSWFQEGVDDTKDNVEDLKREERTDLVLQILRTLTKPVYSWSLKGWPKVHLKGSLQQFDAKMQIL